MPIIIHPLRDRPEDISLLVEYFLDQFSEETRGQKITFSDTALSILRSHPWPGNVRELINTIKFALVKRRGNRIKPEHLPPTLLPYMANHRAIRHRESKLKSDSVLEAFGRGLPLKSSVSI